jgi:hypothetical protein
MWYSGNAHTNWSASSGGILASVGPNQASFCSTFAITFLCFSTAPFDTPVVPPV